MYIKIKGASPNYTFLRTHLVFFSLDRLYLYSGCRKMGLNNSSWLLEASEFPSALGLFCSLHDDFKFAAHRAFKFSYQMHNEVTVIKNVVVLKHGLVADG